MKRIICRRRAARNSKTTAYKTAHIAAHITAHITAYKTAHITAHIAAHITAHITARKYSIFRRSVAAAAGMLLTIIICLCFSARLYAASEIAPLRPAEAAAAAPSGGSTPVPQTYSTPRPNPTPWNQLGNLVTPKPEPTSDPMLQKTIRENVEKVFTSDVKPTPAKATANKQLSVSQAAKDAVDAAYASFRTMQITRSNIEKQVEQLRTGVNMAISALDMDDRYHVLMSAEDLWGKELDLELQMELAMYRQMKYKELTLDERRDLISIRDMGYDRFHFNIRKVDYNIEIMKNQLAYAAYAQYAGIAKMQSAIDIRQKGLDLQKKNLDILKAKYDIGTATRIEYENAEFAYEKAQIEMRAQKRSLTSLVSGFNRLVGENLATTYRNFDRFSLMPAKRDKKSGDYLKSALQNRSEVLIAKEELDLASRQAKLYEIPVSHHDTLADKQEAIQAAEEAGINYDAAVQGIESEIKAAYKQLVALRGLTPYYESQTKSAKENLDRTVKLLELGMTTAAAVDQVYMTVTQAQMQLDNNKTDIWLQQKKMEIICGIGPGGL